MPTPQDDTGNVAGTDTDDPQAATRPEVFVTNNGPVDPKDRTTTVIVPLENPRRDEYFPLGQKVGTTRSTADGLAAMASHNFTIEPATTPEGDE